MNSRLTMAAHILAMLAHHERAEGRATTSEELAASIGTNPVVVRRMLALLRRAGLVTSRRGVGGGSVLARHPRGITLRDAYRAVEEPDTAILGRHSGPLGATCTVAPLIAQYLDDLYADAEEAMLARLDAVTIDAMAREIVDRLRRQQSL